MATSLYEQTGGNPYIKSEQPHRLTLRYLAEMSWCSSKRYSPTPTTEEKKRAFFIGGQNDSADLVTQDILVDDSPRSLSCWRWFVKPGSHRDVDGVIEIAEFRSERNFLSFNGTASAKKRITTAEQPQSRQNVEKVPILSSLAEDSNVVDIKPEPDLSQLGLDYFIREDGWAEDLSVVEMRDWSPTASISLQLMTSVKKKKDDAYINEKIQFQALDAFRPAAFSPEEIKNNIFRQKKNKNTSTAKHHPQEVGEATSCKVFDSTPSTIDSSCFFQDAVFEEDNFAPFSFCHESQQDDEVHSFTSHESMGLRVPTDIIIEECNKPFEQDTFPDITLSKEFGYSSSWDDGKENDAAELDSSDTVEEYYSRSNKEVNFDGFQLIITPLSGDDED